MGKIRGEINTLKMRGFEATLNFIVLEHSPREVMEYIKELHETIDNNDKRIEELITENETIKVKAGLE